MVGFKGPREYLARLVELFHRKSGLGLRIWASVAKRWPV